MEQVIEFISNHWILCAAFTAILLLLISQEYYGKITGASAVSPQQVTTLINRNNALVIDIRDVSSFANGHIVGAKPVLAHELEDRMAQLCADKQRPVVLVCKLGAESRSLANKLKKHGYTQACALAGGIMAWCGENLPLVQK